MRNAGHRLVSDPKYKMQLCCAYLPPLPYPHPLAAAVWLLTCARACAVQASLDLPAHPRAQRLTMNAGGFLFKPLPPHPSRPSQLRMEAVVLVSIDATKWLVPDAIISFVLKVFAPLVYKSVIKVGAWLGGGLLGVLLARQATAGSLLGRFCCGCCCCCRRHCWQRVPAVCACACDEVSQLLWCMVLTLCIMRKGQAKCMTAQIARAVCCRCCSACSTAEMAPAVAAQLAAAAAAPCLSAWRPGQSTQQYQCMHRSTWLPRRVHRQSCGSNSSMNECKDKGNAWHSVVQQLIGPSLYV